MTFPPRGPLTAIRSWPVVPPPRPDECLSSWLARIGHEYGVTSPELLKDAGHASPEASMILDEDPPNDLVAWLARKTGQTQRRIQGMTLSGHVPFLLDGVRPPTACLATYIADTRLITRPNEPIVEITTPPWIDRNWRGQWACAACLETDEEPYQRLSWYLPWMLTCPIHRIFLTRALVHPGRSWKIIEMQPFGRMAPDPELLQLDHATHQAITGGIVDTPTGHISGGLWVRLLRAVIEELAYIVPDATHRGTGVAELWDDIGIRRPMAKDRTCSYETLPPRFKLRRMQAAALALGRARSVLTTWMEGNALPWLDPDTDTVRRSLSMTKNRLNVRNLTGPR